MSTYAIAQWVIEEEDAAGRPLTESEMANAVATAIRAAGYRLVPLTDLPSEAHARASDVAESHDAANSVVMNGKHEAVRRVIADNGPVTDEQMIDAYHGAWIDYCDPLPEQSVSSLRTRRAELVAAGLVRATGETRPTRSGRKAQVWGAVD
jgi:hypothetical protein